MKFRVQELFGAPAVTSSGPVQEFEYLYEARDAAQACTDAGNTFHISAWAGPVAIEASAVMSAIDAEVTQALMAFPAEERESMRRPVERDVIHGMRA